jgi:hypothetical protein
MIVCEARHRVIIVLIPPLALRLGLDLKAGVHYNILLQTRGTHQGCILEIPYLT